MTTKLQHGFLLYIQATDLSGLAQLSVISSSGTYLVQSQVLWKKRNQDNKHTPDKNHASQGDDVVRSDSVWELIFNWKLGNLPV